MYLNFFIFLLLGKIELGEIEILYGIFDFLLFRNK